jgi:hypothetical protein
MSSFQNGYKQFCANTSGYGSIIGGDYVNSVEHEIYNLAENLNGFQGFKTDVQQLKGDVAEFWHSGTHNIDAAVKGATSRTTVNRSHDFASADITSNSGTKFSVKYYGKGASTAKSQAVSFFERYKQSESSQSFIEWLHQKGYSEEDVLAHDPIYQGQVRIIPKGQLEDAIALLNRKIAKESVSRPELVKKYQETRDLLAEKIRTNQNTESIALSDSEAKQLASSAKEGSFEPAKYGLSADELIKFKYLMEQSIKAGLTAATISLVLRAAPHLYKIFNDFIRDGEVESDKFRNLGLAALQGSTEGFVRGSIAAALTIACNSGQLGIGLKAVSPPIIGATTVIVMNTVQNSIRVATGRMTREEFADACMRDLFVSTCSILMGGLTQGAIQIPVLGYMLGSFVGSVTASFIYDAGYSTFLSFCSDTGFTFFKIVNQDYSLPKDVLENIGIDVFAYENLCLQEIPVERFEYEVFRYEKFQSELMEISFLRRGVIGVNKIGYVYAPPSPVGL